MKNDETEPVEERIVQFALPPVRATEACLWCRRPLRRHTAEARERCEATFREKVELRAVVAGGKSGEAAA